MLLSTEMHVAITGQLLLRLPHKSVESSFDVGQTLPDMTHQSSVEGLGQVVSATSNGDITIGRMVLEKVSLGLESILHRLVSLNILLRSIDNADEAKLQRIDAA